MGDQLDALSLEFQKLYPEDPRYLEIQYEIVRQHRRLHAFGIALRSDEEIAAIKTRLESAGTLPKEIRVKQSSDAVIEKMVNYDEYGIGVNAFIQSANKHIRDYPDHPSSQQLVAELLKLEGKLAYKRHFDERLGHVKFTAIDGRSVDLSSLRGKVVLIDFWSAYKFSSMEKIPEMRAAYEKLHSEGFEIIGISFDSEKENLLNELTSRAITWPQYYDGKGAENDLAQKLGVTSVPTQWLIGKDGKIALTSVRNHLADRVEKLLAQ